MLSSRLSLASLWLHRSSSSIRVSRLSVSLQSSFTAPTFSMKIRSCHGQNQGHSHILLGHVHFKPLWCDFSRWWVLVLCTSPNLLDTGWKLVISSWWRADFCMQKFFAQNSPSKKVIWQSQCQDFTMAHLTVGQYWDAEAHHQRG